MRPGMPIRTDITSTAIATCGPGRDWVIEAFNRNQPFDQFTVEQLAGDLLPGASVSQQVASGFNRNHMINFEGARNCRGNISRRTSSIASTPPRHGLAGHDGRLRAMPRSQVRTRSHSAITTGCMRSFTMSRKAGSTAAKATRPRS